MIYEYLNAEERELFLKGYRDAQQKSDRQKLPDQNKVQFSDRQKIKTPRGRPLKFDAQEILKEWDRYCFADWGLQKPLIKPFLAQIGISASLFRSIRRNKS